MLLKGANIALVEDDEIMGASIYQRLLLEGAEVSWLKDANRAIGALRTPRREFDAVVCDIKLPDGSGEDVYLKICEHSAPPPFLFLTGHGGVEQAVRLLRSGAQDYLLKPFEMSDFLIRLRDIIADKQEKTDKPLVGVSHAAQQVESLISSAAKLENPVLILGEAGTGKDILAHRIHELSDRSAAPFEKMNLARLPSDQVLSSLFGSGENTGKFAEAGDGTVYISAISEASDDVQLHLLDLIETGGYKPVGQTERQGFSGRLLLACSTDLDKAVAEGRFRGDLLFRLAALKINVPPLRERPDDVVWLMHQMFDRLNRKREKPLDGISVLTDEAARKHLWAGNGREIKSRLERGVALAQGSSLFPADLFPDQSPREDNKDSFPPLADVREDVERAHILRSLEISDGQMSEAAKLLKISRTTLWEKMQKLAIGQRSDFRK